MKKKMLVLTAVMLFSVLGAMTVFAHGSHYAKASQVYSCEQPCHADADGDSICDYAGNCCPDDEQDGICDYSGLSCRKSVGESHHGHGRYR